MNEKIKKDDFLTVLTNGCRKGARLITESVIPSVIVAFILVQVLSLTGIMDLLGKLLAPVMGLFGLPGEAAVPLVVNISTMTGAAGVTAALAAQGILNSTHVAIMTPYFLLAGGIFLYSGRILGVSGIDPKDQKFCVIMNIVNGILSLFVMRVVMMFF